MLIRRKLNALFDHIINIMAYSAAVLVIFMMLSIGIDVILRNLVGVTIRWAFEISEHSVLYITFFSAPWLLKLDRHVDIDLITSRLSPKGHASLNVVISALGAAITLFITYRSSLTLIDVWRREVHTVTVLELPMPPLIAIIAIGCSLLFIQFMRRTHGYFLERRRLLRGGDDTCKHQMKA